MRKNREMSGSFIKGAVRAFTALAVLSASLFVSCAFALADRKEPTPKALKDVGVTERIDAQIPLGAEFKDENGRPVTLGDYIRGDKPFILTLNYFHCPMLCPLILSGLARGVKPLPWTPGKQFRIITMSFNPAETPADAKTAFEKYTPLMDKPDAAGGWHFLTGDKKNIDAVTDAVGFHYHYDAEKDMYYHVAAIVVGTPDGHVSRYLYGIQFDPLTLRLALDEAKRGKGVSTADRLLLYCCQYDPLSGRYAPVASNIMRLGGVLTLIVLGLFIGSMLMRDAALKKKTAENKKS